MKCRVRRVLLEVELSSSPCAMFDFISGIKEDLEAMQKAGIILDFGISIQEENPRIIRLDKEASEC